MLVGGIVGVVYFFFAFDTTVYRPPRHIPPGQLPDTNRPMGQLNPEADLGGRLHNLGLMADRQNGIIASIGVAVVGGILLLFGHLSARRRQAESVATSHKSLKEAYVSKGGMGLIDFIPGIREAPTAVKWSLLILGVIGAMFVFHVLTGH
jgi:hypothetical protein